MPLGNVANPDYWKTFLHPSKFTLADVPQDLTSIVAIVTGGNTGIGYSTSLALAKSGAHVFIACRDPLRGQGAIEKIEKEMAETAPGYHPKVEFLKLDLADLNQVQESAKEFLKKKLKLNLLINNAGIASVPPTLTKDGLEIQFGVNHLGHFLFTKLLLPSLIENQPSRIVNVSSLAHELAVPEGGIDFDNLTKPIGDPFLNYNRSKLANILFTKALSRKLEASKDHEHIYVSAIHPGFIHSEIDRSLEDTYLIKYFMYGLRKLFARSSDQGCLTTLYAALSPEIEQENLKGRYFVPDGVEMEPSDYAKNEELQEQLWEYSETVVRMKVQGI